MATELNKKIGKATAWSSITEIIAKLISPIVNMVLARLLVPEAFGIVATITMVISFAEVFTDAGFQKYIIQHEFENEEELNKSTSVAFWTNFILSSFICLVIFFFRHSLADLVGSPGLGDSISVSSLLIILAAFSSIQMARYKRDFNFKSLFFVRLGSSLIPLLVTIPLALFLRNYWALLIGNFARELFNAVALTLKSKWKPKFFYDFKLFKEMFSFSAWTLLESISIWLTANVDIFIVGTHLNEYYLGLYKTSMSTVNAYMAIITSALTPILFSALSRYQNDENNFKKTYYTFQRFTALFVIPMGVGIFVFQDLVTEILLGSQWMEASGFIGWWGLTSSINIILAHFSSEVFRSRGKPKISLLSQVIHICFLIPTLLITVRCDFSILYISRSLVRAELILFALIAMRFLYGFKINIILKNILPMILSSLIMGGAGYGLLLVSQNILWQILSVFICIIVYFTILLLLFPKVRKEIFESQYFIKIKNKILKKGSNDQR